MVQVVTCDQCGRDSDGQVEATVIVVCPRCGWAKALCARCDQRWPYAGSSARKALSGHMNAHLDKYATALLAAAEKGKVQ